MERGNLAAKLSIQLWEFCVLDSYSFSVIILFLFEEEITKIYLKNSKSYVYYICVYIL